MSFHCVCPTVDGQYHEQVIADKAGDEEMSE